MDFQSGKSFGKLRLRAFQPYNQMLCTLNHVEDVEDRLSTPMGCNAMYVEDEKGTYTHIFPHHFLNIQWIFYPEKVLESCHTGLFNHIIKYCVY